MTQVARRWPLLFRTRRRALAPPEHASPDDFSLVRGGPFHRLLQKAGLVDVRRPVREALVRIAVSLLVVWVPTLLAAWLSGDVLDFLRDRRAQAELLFAIPVLLSGERYLDGRIAEAALRPLLLSLVPKELLPRYEATLARAGARRDSGNMESVALVLALALTAVQYLGAGKPLAFDARPPVLLYSAIGLPLFWFLLLRWVGWFVNWSVVLYELSRLPLQLSPTHADRTGGLRYLATTQASFSVAAFAAGSVVSALTRQFGGHDVAGGLLAYAQTQVLFAAGVVVALHLPLAWFSRKLLLTKRAGDLHYSAVSALLGHRFEGRWFAHRSDDDPLGEPDFSSLIDLMDSYDTASRMWWFPFSYRALLGMLCASVVFPLAPRIASDREFLELVVKVLPLPF